MFSKSKNGDKLVNFGRILTNEDSFNVSGSFRAQCALFLVVLRASRSRIRAILVSRVLRGTLARAVTQSHSMSLRPSLGDSESNFEVPFGYSDCISLFSMHSVCVYERMVEI